MCSIQTIEGLYFSKVFFGGLIMGGAYVRREICVSKSQILPAVLGLLLEGNLCRQFFHVQMIILGR